MRLLTIAQPNPRPQTNTHNSRHTRVIQFTAIHTRNITRTAESQNIHTHTHVGAGGRQQNGWLRIVYRQQRSMLGHCGAVCVCSLLTVGVCPLSRSAITHARHNRRQENAHQLNEKTAPPGFGSRSMNHTLALNRRSDLQRGSTLF